MKKRGNRARRDRHNRWLLRREKRNFRGTKHASGARRAIFVPGLHLDAYTRRSVQVARDGITLTLPETLDFEDHYEETVSHLRCLREAAAGHIRVKAVRFDDIRYISPSAALVLASEVDRWSQRVGTKLRAAVESWDKQIKRLLCEMGYFELLNIPRPSVFEEPNDVTFLRFIRGDSENRDSGQLAKQLRVNIETMVAKGIKKVSMYEGLSEAITNVGHHAYPSIVVNSRKQWWVSASYNRQSRELFVMFYDQGAGIPVTLPTQWHSFEHLREIFGRLNDSQKIEAAMKYGRSSTKLVERGKGLRNLVEFAKVHEEGRLSIYSLRGLYRLTRTGENETTETGMAGQDHKTSIGGTLIEWSVKL